MLTPKTPHSFTQTLLLILLLSLFSAASSAQTLYGGINFGLAVIDGDDFYTELHTEFGKRWKDRFGLGIAFTHSFGGGVSVTYGIQGAGLQGRLEMGRWLLSADAGAVLGASHTTDWFCNRDYQGAFDPYFRPALSCRFGAFTLGASGFLTTPLRFVEYDEKVNMEEPEICYGKEYLEHFERFTFTLGLNFPPPKRRE